ncbi:MAB_1171c family putative transporter [Kitasatospora sp. NPDC052896]|uniref:MAB_1171c family putative transporter n=1 Tax=Kitasatospora sp. NPDC052896 TaxID=3364061 RepID=UPI0037C587FD
MTPAKLAVIVMLWVVTCWRLPAAVRSPRQRSLWTAFAGLTVAITLGLPALTAWIDRVSHVHNLTVPIKHVVGIVACGAVLTFVADISRPELAARLRGPLRTAVLVASAGLAGTFSLLHQPTEVTDFYLAYPGSVPAACYALIFTGYLGGSMLVASWLFWTYGTRAGAGWLGVGLRILGAGTAAGVVYAVLRLCQVVLHLFDRPMFIGSAVLYGIEWSAIALIVVGNSVPAVGVAWRGLRDWHTARRLGALWTSLTGAVPEVVLTAELGRGPRVRLHRLVIEIRDAELVLAPHAPDGLRERARRAAARTGLSGEPLDAMTEALWLRAARSDRLAGRAPGGVPAQRAAGGFAELDFETETRRLRRLAEAYRSPTADAFAHTHAHAEPQDIP